MRNALAVALLTILTVVFVHPALAQEPQDEGVRLMNARMAQMQTSRAARLGTSADWDTFFVGHTTTTPYSLPWHVGRGPYRPGVGGKFDGMWDFDTYDGGTIDSMQGWVPTVTPNNRTSGTLADHLRPWNCLDWGNRLNAPPVQSRTIGIIGVWHVDNGAMPTTPLSWTPLAGTRSAWCGLRAGNDFSVVDPITGNPLTGETLIGSFTDGALTTNFNFPGYANQWDQMLYRDVRVATGGALTVSFLYKTEMDHRTDNAANTCKGWFDKDPLSMQQGGGGVGASNFISASAYLSVAPAVRAGPIDSFMVYVGVPTDPTACRYADGNAPRPIFDLKRRWFSEVIAIDAPYKEILSTFGYDSAYMATPYTVALDNTVIQPMLDAQGAADGGGVIRIVFRSKTNANYSDETNTGGSFASSNEGAVRIDQVAITGCTPAFVTSGFEAAGEIDNAVEGADSSLPGPAVGQGYALGFWHATGKSPKLMAHTHPLSGGDIGGGNTYSPLAYADLCGQPDSPLRQCNINNVVISTGDHDLGEAVGGAPGTPFKENRNGFLSPAINLVTPPWPGVNDCGLDALHVQTNADWSIYYDMYSGVFDIANQGNVWGNSVASYPATQANGARIWGQIGKVIGVWSNSDKQCFLMKDVLKSNVFTTNPSGIPDSLKLWIFREQRCISWSMPTGCSSTDGHYVDNVALVLPPPMAGCGDEITVDLWDWYTDAFPVNETPGLPGTPAFDTCGAYIQNACNYAPNTGNLLRFDVPGDSVRFRSQNVTGSLIRTDCVFRILPGPGNYVTVGNKASGLRKVPASATPAVSGDLSFWGQYLADPGTYSKGTHAGGWNTDTWNSVRCDTAEVNLFPVNRFMPNLPGIQPDVWMSDIHEDDPHFGALGILKNRCFLIDTLGPNNSTNITCASVPAWLTVGPPSRTGYDGQQQTKEYTKVFPDGLLTAGSHVEYFFRMTHVDAPSWFAMCPDTNRITPQPTGSAPNFDAVRWEGFSILPDRWKDAGYGGLGSACLLVVDYNDRRGNEKVWVGMADSNGLTQAAKYGAHNGWHATAAYVAPDGSHDFTGQTDCGTNPNIAVWKHGGQPGTLWDLYNVKAAESATTGANQIGSRLANRADMGLMTGKQSMQGPTAEMLRAYYDMVFIMSGDLNSAFFGAIANRGQDDIALIQDFLTYQADEDRPRGLWVMGNGFVEGNAWVDAAHEAFLANTLGLLLRDPHYFGLSGAVELYPDLIPTSVVSTSGDIYGFQNSCLFTNDVLAVNVAVSGATAGSYYENLGANGPYVSGVYVPSSSSHPYVTLTDGWDMANLFSRHGGNTLGRLDYFCNVLVNTFGSVCPYLASPGPFGGGCWGWWVAVPEDSLGAAEDFVALRNNPLVSGVATVQFGLARPDRVEARIYDVAGRRVRTLADREFRAGEHRLVWDGTDDRGQPLARGVYFTTVRYVRGGFHAERKLTILR